jgi:hypothetical protein
VPVALPLGTIETPEYKRSLTPEALMNPKSFLALLALAALSNAPFAVNRACADDAADVQQVEETESKEPQPKAAWSTEVQKKYALTPEQMASLEKSGLHGPHLAFAAEAAKASGKSIDEVIQMRTGDKMGWGEIAKKLGLPPGSLGKSAAAVRHDVKAARSDARQEKMSEKRAEKQAAREERKKLREERKAAKSAEREARREAHKKK